jgi:hypothetical protein
MGATVTSGARAARTGRYYEGRAEQLLLDAGWTLVVRSPGSRGPFDLLALHSCRKPLLCQVKRTGGMTPAGWNALYDLAVRVGGTPVLADFPAGEPPRFRELTTRRTAGERGRLPLAPYHLGGTP